MPKYANDANVNKLIAMVEAGDYAKAIRFAFSASGPLAYDKESQDVAMAKVGQYLYLEPGDTIDLKDAANYVRRVAASALSNDGGLGDV